MRIIVIFFSLLFTNYVFATTDSLKVKTPKHFFKTVIYFNSYNRPLSKVITNRNRDSYYSFVQRNLGFYTPLYTKVYEDPETKIQSNFHLLLTGNLLVANPQLTYVTKISKFYKPSIGVRAIFNGSGKNFWFFDLSPFKSFDLNSRKNATLRFSSVFVYNRLVSENFSFKVGYYKTFLFGSSKLLPIIGFRIGRLDKINFQLQFPRNLSLNMPINNKIAASVFVKNVGGVYTYRTKNFNDSIVIEPTVQFGRFEALSGALINFNLSPAFSFFLSSGFSTRSQISFSKLNKEVVNTQKPIRKYNLQPTLFFNVGLAFSFGKVKRDDNNFAIYEVKDLNKSIDPGDNNDVIQEPSINKNKPSKKDNLGYEDIKDFINADDLN